MKEINRFIFLNQMAGPLFRELAEGLADTLPGVSVLKTGHPGTLSAGSASSKLVIESYPEYDRGSYFSRIMSWVKYTLLVSFSMLKADKNTAIFIVSNPPLLGPAAWLVNKLKGTPYIVLVYDMHPDTMVNLGVLSEGGLLTRAWRRVNRKVWNNACAVYTIGPVMADNLGSQFDASKTLLGRVGVIPPWADTEKIKPLEKASNPLAIELNQLGKTTVLYSGNMGLSHDIDSILQAAKLLRDEPDIAFLMIGEGEKWQFAFDFQRSYGLFNLQVLPFQPEERLPFTMPLADIALVALDPGAEGLMVPSKMFYYMAAGAAIVGISSGRNDVSETISSCGCGVNLEPKSPYLLAESIRRLANNRKQLQGYKLKAREFSETQYSREICLKNITANVEALFSRGKA